MTRPVFHHLDRSDPALAVPFAQAVFAAYFHDVVDTGDAEVMRRIGESLGLDGEGPAAAIADAEIKALAKARSQEAVDRGVFGSPGCSSTASRSGVGTACR